MIDRQHSKILIECDSCDQVFEGETGAEFSAVWASARREGWRTAKIADEWLHGCPKHGIPK